MNPLEDKEFVVLVDAHDREIGVRRKLEAHRSGELHRALSVVLVNGAGEWLLHRRAAGKYHSPGLWTNACCSHPRPGERVEDAAHRRLREEMGMACALEPAFGFVYRAEFAGGLVEHEYDHVFVGRTDAPPSPDPDEVDAVRYVPEGELRAELAASPERFTAWFRLLFEPAAAAIAAMKS